jgi:hypothetical protein
MFRFKIEMMTRPPTGLRPIQKKSNTPSTRGHRPNREPPSKSKGTRSIAGEPRRFDKREHVLPRIADHPQLRKCVRYKCFQYRNLTKHPGTRRSTFHCPHALSGPRLPAYFASPWACHEDFKHWNKIRAKSSHFRRLNFVARLTSG